jgi:hypothetical protein
VLANDQGTHLLISNFKMRSQKPQVFKLESRVNGLRFLEHHLVAETVAADGSFELQVIDWENKVNFGRVNISVSDPKVLRPRNLLLLADYAPQGNAFYTLTHLWVLQNYTLGKSLSGCTITESAPAGYSLHCLDRDLKEQFSTFIPSHENAIMFARAAAGKLGHFQVAETTRIKTVELRGEKEIKIVR